MTGSAHRVRRNGCVLYVMPDRGRETRLLYRQDAETLETERTTVSNRRACELAQRGRETPLWTTPAWCDPDAPNVAHGAHTEA